MISVTHIIVTNRVPFKLILPSSTCYYCSFAGSYKIIFHLIVSHRSYLSFFPLRSSSFLLLPLIYLLLTSFFTNNHLCVSHDITSLNISCSLSSFSFILVFLIFFLITPSFFISSTRLNDYQRFFPSLSLPLVSVSLCLCLSVCLSA